MIKRVKFRSKIGELLDLVVNIIEGQTITVKRLQDDKVFSIQINDLIAIVDAVKATKAELGDEGNKGRKIGRIS